MADATRTTLLESLDDPAELRRLPRQALSQVARRVAGVHSGLRGPHGRASVIESRHGRAHHRAALRVRYAERSPRLGRRSPDVRAQDPDRSTRQMIGCACRADPRASRAASESDYDTFGTAHSSTSISAALGMAVPPSVTVKRRVRRGHRRRRDVRGHGVRSDEQRRRRWTPTCWCAERQRHVDLGARRRAQQLSRPAAVGPHVLQRPRGGKRACSVCVPRCASSPSGSRST